MVDDATLRADLAAAYDADAARRAGNVPDPWRLAVLDEWADELAERDLASVLELGCGTGQMAVHMVEAGFELAAIDLSPGNVAASQERGVEAAVADFAHLPFPDAAYDAAFAFNSLLHVPPGQVEKVLAEVRRVVRVGGLVLIVVWGGIDHWGPMPDEWLDPPRYFNLHTDDQMEEVTVPGLRKVRFTTIPDAAVPMGLHPQVLVLEAVQI